MLMLMKNGRLGRSFMCLSLLLLLCGGSAAFAPSTQAAGSFTADQLAALDKLNQVRAAAGVPPVTLSAQLSEAASNHAKYYNLQPGKAESAHDEREGNPGFTGTGPSQRMKATGWKPIIPAEILDGFAAGEVMHFFQKSSSDAIDGWLDTAYHRTNLLQSTFTEVGIGLEEGTAVVDLGGSGHPRIPDDQLVLYPYNGMSDAGVGFYGNEVPNPLAWFNVSFSGYIISVQSNQSFIDYEFKLTDPSGKSLDTYVDEKSRELYFIPKKLLHPNTVYRAELRYKLGDGTAQKTHGWSFSTGNGLPVHRLSTFPQVTVNEGESIASEFTATFKKYSDAYEDVTAYTTVSPASAAGYRFQNGRIYGLKAGTYNAEATYGGVKAKIQITVLPKLKTVKTAVSSTDATAWARSSGAPARKADSPVTEAEFLTLLLQAYRTDLAGYAPKKSVHWADGAYVVATARNLPVSGGKSTALRDKPITRGRAAELIAGASGVSYAGEDANRYVSGLDYMRGAINSYADGFGSSQTMSFAEASVMLRELPAKNGGLSARPGKASPVLMLPDWPEINEYFVVPDKLDKSYMIARYSDNGVLKLTGHFPDLPDRTFRVKIDAFLPRWKEVAVLPVSLDANGDFELSLPGLDATQLNVYLDTEENYYYVDVHEGTMNISEFGDWADE
ncbi:CAP domain-containing protein [Saccharibacillus sacchari]|uniref:CAP domain-containing protein n=1 Tax=Saccharibacillus sacchari TaxID=456493 RepID=A0ACC6PFV7_9BACL